MKQQIEKLTPEVEQVFLGSMVGDGRLHKASKGPNVNATFYEAHNIKQEKYLLSKMKILDSCFKMKVYYPKYDTNRIEIMSLVSPILTKYHKLFYPSGRGRKIMPYNLLLKLGPLGLAIWYQDDGDYKKYGRCCSISIYKKNIKNVKKFLESMGFNIHITPKKNSGAAYVGFSVTDTQKFFSIIRPYIHRSMIYKIKISKKEQDRITKHISEYHKKYYVDNREKKKKYSKDYYNKNTSECNKRNKRWQDAHPEKGRIYRNTFKKKHPKESRK